jgi:hypothetical protein
MLSCHYESRKSAASSGRKFGQWAGDLVRAVGHADRRRQLAEGRARAFPHSAQAHRADFKGVGRMFLFDKEYMGRPGQGPV